MNPSAQGVEPGRSAAIGEGPRIDVGDALSVHRPTLGEGAGVVLYRLLRLVGLDEIVGRGAAATSYIAGKKIGNRLGFTTLDQFLEFSTALKLGIVEVPVLTESRIRVEVYECVTCSGLRTVGRPLCHFEAGLIAGVVETVFDKRAKAREATCIGGLGQASCGIEIDLA